MDIVGLLFFLLFWALILVSFVIIQKGMMISIAFMLLVAAVILFFLYLLIRYSGKITPEPIIPTHEHPLSLIGGICEVLDEISPAKSGWVRYRGELWKAFSVRSIFKRGDVAYVVDVRDRYLIIEREPPIRRR